MILAYAWGLTHVLHIKKWKCLSKEEYSLSHAKRRVRRAESNGLEGILGEDLYRNPALHAIGQFERRLGARLSLS